MKNTWASGALELLSHADAHIDLDTAFDKRIAFISIDNCVETAVRTFIALPSKKSGVKFSRKERADAGNSFPKLISLVFKHASKKVVGLDDDDIEFYHRIRNTLYHEGTGLSVDENRLRAYRNIAGVLLNNLFGVSLPVEKTKLPSLANIILLWNEIEQLLRKKMLSTGIDMGNTYKWEEAVREGILTMDTVQKITELRMIRNQVVHSTSDQLDFERIKLGISLGENILKQLNG